MIAHRAVPTIGSVALLATLAIALSSCESDDDTSCADLSAADTARIEAEVRQALDDYAASVVAGDRERVEFFWGDFDDFIHAGDGRVFGDREAWLGWMTSNRPDETISWEFSEVHVAVLGANAASYTANFEVLNLKGGDESTTTGSWTYVLRKTDDGWRVVQSNGMHNEFSYYGQSRWEN
jgi:ketosteroid isomerase-like protein